MKIWISENLKKKNHYAARVLLPVLGSLLLVICLITGSIFLGAYLDLPMEILSFAVCIAATALLIWAAAGTGRRSLRDALVFCQDRNGDIYVSDVRKYSAFRRGSLGFVSMAFQTQKVLDNMLSPGGVLEKYLSQERSLQGLEPRILSVEKIKENRKTYSMICHVELPGNRLNRQTYVFSKGYDNEKELLHELELLTASSVHAEVHENRNPAYIILSTVVLILFVILCVCSHPAIALLPAGIYFPCLAAPRRVTGRLYALHFTLFQHLLKRCLLRQIKGKPFLKPC